METWPKGFMDIGGLTFDEVYERKKEFVEFTLHSMTKCSGMFKRFQDFCREKEKNAQLNRISCRNDVKGCQEIKKAE